MDGKYFVLSFTAAMLFCVLAGSAIQVKNINTDESALLALKAHITLDPQTHLVTNWSTTAASICYWEGVTCGTRHGRVTALDLSSMDLTGTIPPHIGNLSFLSRFSLRNNNFHDPLPVELARLHRLRYMTLGYNNFTGEIPSWFGDLSELQQLELGNNNFVGLIPTSLCNLSKLETLYLNNNRLQGSIPEAIGNLHNLKILYLGYNGLSGSIPSTIFNISSLQNMSTRDNWLSGSMPSVTNVSSSLLRYLDVSTNNLTGHISNDIFYHLPQLEFVYLSSNMFSGRIPLSLFECKMLVTLSLRYNHFNGIIPEEIGNLTRLKFLRIGYNDFTGKIPRQIGDLKSLEFLSIRKCNLSGPIPSIITNLTSLQLIELSHNYLSGTIPEMDNLNRLQFLALQFNKISGFIPSSIFNISTMEIIYISNNYLSGKLPESTGLSLPSLQHLALGHNKFIGPIPSFISNASQLTNLDLQNNSFSDLIPDSLGNLINLKWLNLGFNLLTAGSSSVEMSFLSSLTNCKHLTYLAVSGNSLNGALPISIGNLSVSLQKFAASGCNIKGGIPREISSLTNLMLLTLGHNDLIGTIPTSIGMLAEIEALNLQNNKLEGAIPIELCGLEKLSELYLGFNKLSGPIPQCLANLKLLRKLQLNFNSFTGMLPLTLWMLRDILELNLTGNSLNGSISPNIQNLKVVELLDLSNNYFFGDIPNNFAPLTNLKKLSLSNNRLQGHIPQSVGNLISLEFLDLSRNNLSGEIPKSLEVLRYLKYLNVSFNRLQGAIPNGGPFANFTIQSFVANEALCGAPWLQLPPCEANDTKGWRKVVVICILAITTSTILIAVLLFLFFKYRKNKRNLPAAEEDAPSLVTWRGISYHELMHATDGFHVRNLIGRGSYGSVYKGILADGMNVAIKVFDLQLEGAFRSFISECEVLSNIRHRNLMKIISCCSNDDFKAILLDYMPKGSLEKWLHFDNYHLDILKRLGIVLDVSSALEYLHYGYSTPIVHCDLKPSNVLLDEDMVAHLSDFGITKLLGKGQSTMLTQTLATIGYMAPEYGSEGKISREGDVYSFGILLMETFTRKKPTDEIFSGDMSLKQLIGDSLLNGTIVDVVDSSLLQQNDLHFHEMVRCVSSVLSLAIDCTTDSPHDRINVTEVAKRLGKIKYALVAGIEGQSRHIAG